MTQRLWWLRLRDLLTPILLLLVVVVFVGFAGLTARPEAEIWDRVEEVAVVGPGVARLRALYLPPTVDPGRATASRASARDVAGDPPDLEFVGVGARLLAAPSSDAPLIETTRSLTQYPVAERRGRWAQIVLRAIDDEPVTAWVDTEAERDQSEPPMGNAPEPPKPRPASPATQAQLDAVLEHLEQPIVQDSASGYSLLFGFRDPTLTAMLKSELGGLEAQYRSRYRLDPIGKAVETIVVFRDESSYRAYQETAPRLSGLQSAGHSSRGLVALFKGDRPTSDVRDTLRHEIAHLLNRRALGPALPPWLGEGLADDLALLTRIEGDDPFATYRFRLGNQTLYRGPLASLRLLLQTLDGGDWVPLSNLLGLDWDQFVRGGRSALLYAQSSFLVHWLLETREDAFHRFLTGVSLGRPPSAAELGRTCGVEISELDREFRAWLEAWRPRAN